METITMKTITMKTITPPELCRCLEECESIDLIDVRTPAEYEAMHVEPARLMPLDRLDPRVVARERRGGSDTPLYVICHTGTRAREACRKLLNAGVENVVLVEGGTQGWARLGLPVVRGRKALSVERQVRIAAGALTLVGALLGLWHPLWFLLPAAVGAGLMHAGATDTCLMGMLLTRMPWNQRVTSAASGTPRASQCGGAAPGRGGA